MKSETHVPSIKTCVPMANVFLIKVDLTVNAMKVMKRTEMANVWTKMNVKVGYVAMVSVGTIMEDLIANVHQDSICLPMVLNVQTSMNVNKLVCVPMVFVQTWMDHSSASVMMDSSFLLVVLVALMLTNVKKIHLFAYMEDAEIQLVHMYVNAKMDFNIHQKVDSVLTSMSAQPTEMFVGAMEDVSMLKDLISAFAILDTLTPKELVLTSMNA